MRISNRFKTDPEILQNYVIQKYSKAGCLTCQGQFWANLSKIGSERSGWSIHGVEQFWGCEEQEVCPWWNWITENLAYSMYHVERPLNKLASNLVKWTIKWTEKGVWKLWAMKIVSAFKNSLSPVISQKTRIEIIGSGKMLFTTVLSPITVRRPLRTEFSRKSRNWVCTGTWYYICIRHPVQGSIWMVNIESFSSSDQIPILQVLLLSLETFTFLLLKFVWLPQRTTWPRSNHLFSGHIHKYLFVFK